MADVVAKIRAGQPIKSGTCVSQGPGMTINSYDGMGHSVDDSYITNEQNLLGTRYRNRLYYTTGEADPPDPS